MGDAGQQGDRLPPRACQRESLGLRRGKCLHVVAPSSRRQLLARPPGSRARCERRLCASQRQSARPCRVAGAAATATRRAALAVRRVGLARRRRVSVRPLRAAAAAVARPRTARTPRAAAGSRAATRPRKLCLRDRSTRQHHGERTGDDRHALHLISPFVELIRFRRRSLAASEIRLGLALCRGVAARGQFFAICNRPYQAIEN